MLPAFLSLSLRLHIEKPAGKLLAAAAAAALDDAAALLESFSLFFFRESGTKRRLLHQSIKNVSI